MNPEYKNCPFCDEEIKVNAVKCRHCGEFLDAELHLESVEEKQTVIYQGREWSPGIAALLSLFIPGAGQIYKGNVASGIGWLIFVPIGYFMFLVPGIILHIICIATAASGNPYPEQRRSNKRTSNEKKGLHPAFIIIILILAYIALKQLSGE